jgi:hypothetical protein
VPGWRVCPHPLVVPISNFDSLAAHRLCPAAHLTRQCVSFARRQQLEDLEDKLRELRFVAQDKSSAVDAEDQKMLLLGQLDGLRKDLVEAAYAATDKVVYGKELLKDIISFALADDDENKMATPRPARGRFSVENTPKGKRAPAVPDSLEGPYGRNSFKMSPGSSAGRSDWSGRPPRPDSTASKRGTPSRWTEDEQRKYSSFSRTITVSNEDIYGPEAPVDRFGASPDPQKYGGTVKVKELLAKAEQGLTDVASAQKGRRIAPRVIHDDMNGEELDGEAWMEQELGNDEFHSSNTHYATPGAESRQRKALMTTPSSQSRPTNAYARHLGHQTRRDGESSVQHIDNRHESLLTGGGLLGAISRLASLAIVAGGIAAGAVLVSKSATRPAALPKASPSKKKRSKARRKKASPEYRGEADIYVSEAYSGTSDDTVYFDEHSAEGPQSPVVNVHRPPATTHFPAASPDVSVAMG